MNKRITSILLCFIMVFSILVSAVPVYAATYESTQLKVIPDKTTANPGDIITYTIIMGPVSDMGSMQMVLDIPTGLTYVENSGKLADGLKTTLGFDAADWTEASKRTDPLYPGSMINGYASAADYECDTDTTLATFQCKVNNDFTGTVSVGLVKLEFGSCQTFEEHTTRFSVASTAVTVAAAPVAVTGVTIDETLSVNIGQTKTPSFTVAPAEATNKTVSFTSDNPAVATVNATTGEVTGVSKGTATITVKTADGNFTDTCTVTVSCAHTNKSTVPAKDSTCTVKGWDEYKECDDCGQLFDTSDVEIDEIPFLNLAKLTGGTATCTEQAVCSVCHQPYGNYAAHSYTAETKKAEALKTAGNCRDKAVYYYSCSVCGNVEHNDAHTFEGDKNASVHVGGTSTVNASEPDHKNQVDGYTGDTKCLGCGGIIATGTSIPAGAHTPSSTWNSDGTYHWKECTTVGCGVVIDGSKAEHSSTGTNVATCQHKAVCDVCNVEYGALAAHNPASGWTSDASGHWHACQTAGCTEKCDFATHTPDHTGHATEEYAIKCTECGYVIEAQLGHTHVFDKEVATEAYKATDATCTAKATYYKSCACGEKGTATFEYGELADHNWTPATCTAPKTCSVCHATEGDPLGHTEGTEWKSDKDNHWHTCTVAGCGVVIESSKAAHTPDREAATETDPIKCSVCDYIITPALGMQDYIVEMPVSIAVKLTGDKKPAKETFKFEIYDLGVEDAEFEILNDSVTAENIAFDENGVAFIEGIIKIKVTGEDQLCNLTEGFNVRMVKGSTKGWTYASEQWRIELFFENDALDFGIAVKEIVDGEISEEYANCMSFAVSYEAVSEPDPTESGTTEPSKPADPQSPQTGDNSMMGLWIALLFVSGVGVVGTTIYSRKKKYTVK